MIRVDDESSCAAYGYPYGTTDVRDGCEGKYTYVCWVRGYVPPGASRVTYAIQSGTVLSPEYGTSGSLNNMCIADCDYSHAC